MQNIEIKAPVSNLRNLLDRIQAMGAKREWTRIQRDTFFNVPEGYLKLRTVENRPGELISYTRDPGTDPRPSQYEIAEVDDRTRKVLNRSLGIRGVLEKSRTLFIWKHTRIHVDQISGLGTFVELEAVAKDIDLTEAKVEAEQVIQALALDRGTFLEKPYLELMIEISETVIIEPSPGETAL